MNLLRHTFRLLVIVLLSALILLNAFYTLKGQSGGDREIAASPVFTYLDELHGSSPHRLSHQVFAQGSL